MFRPTLVLLALGALAQARHDVSVCGTTRETSSERLFLHRQAERVRRLRPAALVSPRPAARDIGNIAIVEDNGDLIEKLNEFNLDNSTVTFTPSTADASRYRFAISGASYDSGAAAQGAPVAGLGDDDAREIAVPFSFPFFGTTYRKLWINSDGDLTFVTAENASSSRLTGRVTGGPPRIAALFDDLDPSKSMGSVRVFSGPSYLAISWVEVPEYSDFGRGRVQTFQIRLYPDGGIALAYAGASPTSAVAGIAPGYAKGATTLVSFKRDASAEYSAAVVERFGDTQEIDIVLAAQRFYQTHGDAYDYLFIYNNANISAMQGAIAYESTVRSNGSGWGVPPVDNGMQYGSGSRLLSVINMGYLSQYPVDPNAILALRGPANDTPLTILGHEAGHLFLANASINDSEGDIARPMLGFGGVHWSFVFNSEASLDEGERIVDRGTSASPRFLTTDVTQGYSPLDQYLMGFRAPADVPPTFVVTGTNSRQVSPTAHPAGGIAFDGYRLDVGVRDIADAEGRRTPDSTVAQRRFRFAFILIVPAGTDVAPADLQQVETYRAQFAAFYSKVTSGNAGAETTLSRSLKLSLFPASGILSGASSTASLMLESATTTPLTVQLRAAQGFARVPDAVTIPAGSTSASFTITGVTSGVEEVTATPLDSLYETAFARVQVAAAQQARLTTVSTSSDAVVVQLSDVNNLPYPGARIIAAATSGSVTPALAVTDWQGRATFQWDTGSTSDQVRLTAEAQPEIALTLTGGFALPVIGGVVNAASYAPSVAPGSIAALFGTNLAGAASVTVNGAPAPVFYGSATQINFYIPPGVPTGRATVSVALPSGASASFETAVVSEQAGIFAIVPRSGMIEIYATGLGATRPSGDLSVTTLTPTVFFGSTAAVPVFSGLAPGFTGLYQINAAIPAGISGTVPVTVSIGNSVSNTVGVAIP
jgi:uncharacterized protein (TIGR03437 family)